MLVSLAKRPSCILANIMAMQGDRIINEHVYSSILVEVRSSLDRSTSIPSADPSVTASYEHPGQARHEVSRMIRIQQGQRGREV